MCTEKILAKLRVWDISLKKFHFDIIVKKYFRYE